MVSTRNSAGWPAASIALRIAAIGERQPVAVSLWRTQTALISWPLSAAQMLLDDLRVGAGAPIGLDEFGLEAQPFRHHLPQRGELAGLDHQHFVAGRQRVGERRLPGAGAGRGIDDDRLRGLEDGLDALEHALGELGEFRAALVDERHVDRAQDAVGNGRRPGNLQEMAPGKARGILRHFRHSFRRVQTEPDRCGKPAPPRSGAGLNPGRGRVRSATARLCFPNAAVGSSLHFLSPGGPSHGRSGSGVWAPAKSPAATFPPPARSRASAAAPNN